MARRIGVQSFLHTLFFHISVHRLYTYAANQITIVVYTISMQASDLDHVLAGQ